MAVWIVAYEWYPFRCSNVELAVTNSALAIFRLMLLFCPRHCFYLNWHRASYSSQKYVYISTRFPSPLPLLLHIAKCDRNYLQLFAFFPIDCIIWCSIAQQLLLFFMFTCIPFVLLSLSLRSFFNFSIFASLFAKTGSLNASCWTKNKNCLHSQSHSHGKSGAGQPS